MKNTNAQPSTQKDTPPTSQQNPPHTSQTPQSKNNRLLKLLKLLLLFSIVIILIGLCTFTLIRCQKKPTPTSQPTPKTSLSPTTTPEPLGSLISSSHNTLGIDLLKQINQEEAGENIVISPASIALALSMAYNGADGETKKAMANTMHTKTLDIEELNKASTRLINSLEKADPKVEIAIANSLWANKDVKFKPDFLATNKKYYDAQIKALDFLDPETVNIINSWVSKNTKEKIPTIINPPIPRDAVMYLINAIYFYGSWTYEFDKKLTAKKPFTLSDNTTKQHSLMKQKREDFVYLENNNFQAVSLPYGDKKRLSMYVFLPKDSLDQFAQKLNINTWNTWMAEFSEMEGTLLLPKFKLEYEKKLNEPLKVLGMKIAFTNQANFDKMNNDPNYQGFKIDEVKHKTFIEVDEEGTEAAAVTSIGMVGTTALPPEKKTFYMKVNKPFFFAIQDNQTKEILFMGFIQNPK